jgi:hypothetical protein
MTLHFEDGSVDVFKINQKYAINNVDAEFDHSTRSYNIYYERSGNKELVIRIENTKENS